MKQVDVLLELILLNLHSGTKENIERAIELTNEARQLVKLCNISHVSNHVVCDKCNDTGVIWSSDKLSARTCGCK